MPENQNNTHPAKILASVKVTPENSRDSMRNIFTVEYRYVTWLPNSWRLMSPKADWDTEKAAASVIVDDVRSRRAKHPESLEAGVEYRITVTTVAERTLCIYTTLTQLTQ